MDERSEGPTNSFRATLSFLLAFRFYRDRFQGRFQTDTQSIRWNVITRRIRKILFDYGKTF